MIQERLKAVIAYSGLNDSAFAKRIGMQQITLWRQLNDQRKVSLETIMAVADAFPEIDANWLLRGNGSMLADNDAQEKRIDNLIDVISMQQETIKNLQDKIKQLQNS
jgi:transcriptional regulator with XRE-family HTH domain